MKTKFLFLLPIWILLLPGRILGQAGELSFEKIVREDTAAVKALALYPDTVRNSALEVCRYPEIIVKMEALQKNTSAAFRVLLEPLTRDEQQKVWDIVRYPGLADALGGGTRKSPGEITAILKNYPAEIHKTAQEYGSSHYELLKKISAMNGESAKSLNALTAAYPPAAQKAVKEILNYPELVSILADNMKTTVMLGDAYKTQPLLIRHKLDSMNLDAVRENARNLEDWKKSLDDDPQAKTEFEAAAKEYAGEQGYTGETIVIHETQVITNYVCYPYPYWYGYPWWWDYPYWYPYPYWYDWGYYYGPYGIVYIGYPSFHFMHWYYFHNHHHYHYPHFSEHCYNYYYGHRRIASGMNSGIEHWERETKGDLPAGFLANDGKRINRFEELGKLEIDRNEYNKQHPDKPVSSHDYYQQNTATYPSIGTVPKPEERPRPQVKPRDEHVYPPVFPKQEPRQQPAQQPKQTPKPQPQKPKQVPPAPKPKNTEQPKKSGKGG